MASGKKKSLGKGLSALIGSDPLTLNKATTGGGAQRLQKSAMPDGSELLSLDPKKIEPNPKQPRHSFNEEKLQELAQSIKQDGVHEAINVRRVGDKYELVSGERRVRASIMAGLKEIPAICREVSDRDMLKLGLLENIQREDLNAIEIATGYQDLIDQFNWTQEELANELGKNRGTVANTLRLLNLPNPVQKLVAEESLTMGHAKALLALGSAQEQIASASKIIDQGLSVRQAEKLGKKTPTKQKKTLPPTNIHLATIEDRLRRAFGTKVTLRTLTDGRGKIEIEYYNNDELERILVLLRK